MKEVKLKHVAGPFKKIPFKSYIQSPVGLVPKAGGEQIRLIFHLSYNFDRKNEDGLGSLNKHSSREKCKVKCHDLDYAVNAYLKLHNCEAASGNFLCDDSLHDKPSERTVFGGKTDITSTFHLLPLSKWSWRWLVFKAQDPSRSKRVEVFCG